MYRDDHDAALLRIDALERENDALSREVDRLRTMQSAAPPVIASARTVIASSPPPPTFDLTDTRYTPPKWPGHDVPIVPPKGLQNPPEPTVAFGIVLLFVIVFVFILFGAH
jgi:hypothetical protein